MRHRCSYAALSCCSSSCATRPTCCRSRKRRSHRWWLGCLCNQSQDSDTSQLNNGAAMLHRMSGLKALHQPQFERCRCSMQYQSQSCCANDSCGVAGSPPLRLGTRLRGLCNWLAQASDVRGFPLVLRPAAWAGHRYLAVAAAVSPQGTECTNVQMLKSVLISHNFFCSCLQPALITPLQNKCHSMPFWWPLSTC